MPESSFHIEHTPHCTTARSRSAQCAEKWLHSRTVEMRDMFVASVNAHPHFSESRASTGHLFPRKIPTTRDGTHVLLRYHDSPQRASCQHAFGVTASLQADAATRRRFLQPDAAT